MPNGVTIIGPIYLNVSLVKSTIEIPEANTALKVRVYDGTPLSPEIYDIVLLEGGETITLPTSPVNGERYTFYVIDFAFIPEPVPSIIINPNATIYSGFAVATYVFPPVIGSKITYCFSSHVNIWLILDN